MATHGARRVLTMSNNTLNVIAIEFLAACQGIDFRKPLKTSPLLQQAHDALRAVVPFATSDRLLADDIEAAARVVRLPAVQSLASLLSPSFR
jgi:histidine ammonia-lyase